MNEKTEKMGTDGIVDIRVHICVIMQNTAKLLVYGTAVKLLNNF